MARSNHRATFPFQRVVKTETVIYGSSELQWQIQDFLEPGAWVFFVLNNEVNFGHKKTLAFTVVKPACIYKSKFC